MKKHKATFDHDFDFDGRDNFYHATGIDDISRANDLHVFSALALLHDHKNTSELEKKQMKKSILVVIGIVIAIFLIVFAVLSIISHIKNEEEIKQATYIAHNLLQKSIQSCI